MSSLGKQQDAMIKSAEQAEKLVVALEQLTKKLEEQHNDSAVSQRNASIANYVMCAAIVVMTIATVVMAVK